MRYLVIIAVCVAALLLFVSCGSKDSTSGVVELVTQKTDKIAGSKVSAADVVDFSAIMQSTRDTGFTWRTASAFSSMRAERWKRITVLPLKRTLRL